FFGGPEREVLLMETERVNREGGIRGRPIRLEIEDSKSSAREGVSALQKALLSRPGAVITALTIVSEATQPILDGGRIPQFALSVHPLLARGSRFTIRPYYGYEGEIALLVRHIRGGGARTLGVLWVQVPECEAAVTEILTPTLAAAGGEVVASEPFGIAQAVD